MNKPIRPIRFLRLEVGSRFEIFAEPSRDIQRSSDQNVYIKEAESYSVNAANKDHVIILMPEDLVQPLTRGRK